MRSSTKFITFVTTAAVAASCFIVADASAAGGAKAGNGNGNRPAGAAAGQRGPAQPPFVAPAAKYLGMKPAALMKQLKAKKTLATIAESKGKSVDGLKDAIVASAKARLDKDVAAERIDQAGADAKLADLQSRIDDIVTKPLPARGPGGGDCPNRPGGGAGAAGTDTGYGDTGNTATTGTTTGDTYL